MSCRLQLKTKICKKDSSLLYDFKSNEATETTIEIKNDCNIFRKNMSIICTRNFLNELNYCFKIVTNKEDYFLSYDYSKNNYRNVYEIIHKSPWMDVAKTYSYNNKGIMLNKSSFIRFGKIVLKVKDLKYEENDAKFTKIFENDKTQTMGIECYQRIQIKPKKSRSNHETSVIIKENIDIENYQSNRKNSISAIKKTLPVCRICLLDEDLEFNPLINPCKCSGSMKYIHLNCLKNWLKLKIKVKNFKHLTIHTYKSLKCELCNYFFPEKVKVKNKLFETIALNLPDSNYIILESVSKEKFDRKFFFIFNFKKVSQITLGRSNESDIKINDASVSRNHSIIYYIKDEGYYIKDMDSKFGTYVEISDKIQIHLNKYLVVQSERCLFYLKIVKTFCSFFRCYKFNNDEKNYNNYSVQDRGEDHFNELIECGYNGSLQEEDQIKENDEKYYYNITKFEGTIDVNKITNEQNLDGSEPACIRDDINLNKTNQLVDDANRSDNNFVINKNLILLKENNNSNVIEKINGRNLINETKNQSFKILPKYNLLDLFRIRTNKNSNTICNDVKQSRFI